MKNNIFYIFFVFFIFLNSSLFSQELDINSATIQYDNANKVTIFEGSVNLTDEKGNKIYSEYLRYNKLDELIETKGETRIITTGGYEVLSSNIFFDNKKKLIHSNYKTQIKNRDGNKVLVDMFNYSTSKNIFFSKGNILMQDINDNKYNFSEIYIDENKKKIVGSDIKVFLTPDTVGASGTDNEPRFFANTVTIDDKINTFDKGIFTYCKIKKNEKCPPWVLKSKKIKHDLTKKTIYYDDVVLKIYDFPIFYAPKFSHPDPTVKRRSGFLAPTTTNSNSVGTGFSAPYFWNIASNKDLTLTPKLYLTERPLILAEYRQDFKNSYLIVDSGFTKGYKKKSIKKTSGNRAHFFSKFGIDLTKDEEKNSSIELNIQKVSNDTYFKIHDISTSLVNKSKFILENTIDYVYQNKDFYFGLTPSAYEDTTKKGNLRYEYLLPLTIEKNIISNEKYGLVNLKTNVEIRNYETSKQTSFLVNDFNWKSNKWLNKFGFENYFEGLIKTVNYKAKKTKFYKNDNENMELNSALVYFAKLGLYKNDFKNKTFKTLTPKFLLRYAPGHMRSVEYEDFIESTSSSRFDYSNLFNLNKVDKLDVVENGLSASVGFEYKKNNLDKENNIKDEVFTLSVGQVISAKENLDIPSHSSLDQKFSDVVGVTSYKVNKNIQIEYNFSIDQNYKNFNYNEIATDVNFEKAKFNLSYLQEKNHIGNSEFIETGIDYDLNNFTELTISTKRNLLTNSAEFYNLSYNYINDCLKAGIGYRREFYTDRDIEPANTLMFTISIIPFGEINSPSF